MRLWLLLYSLLVVFGAESPTRAQEAPIVTKPGEMPKPGTSIAPLFLKNTVAVSIEFTIRNTNCQAMNTTYYVCRVPYTVGSLVDENGVAKQFQPIFAVQASERDPFGSVEVNVRVLSVSPTELTFQLGSPPNRVSDPRFIYHASYIVFGILQ